MRTAFKLAVLLALAGGPVVAQYPARQSQPPSSTAMEFQNLANTQRVAPRTPVMANSPVDDWTIPAAAQKSDSPVPSQGQTIEDLKKDRKKYVTLPATADVFAFPGDRALEQVILDRLRQDERAAGRDPNMKYPPILTFPTTEPVGGGIAYQPKTATYPPMRIHHEPLYVVHRRLHFEEKNAERYGWDLGIIQTFVSAAYFYKDVLLWPNSLASGVVSGFWDTNAGKCLPGSPTPYMLYPPGLTITVSVVEGLFVTGVAFAIP